MYRCFLVSLMCLLLSCSNVASESDKKLVRDKANLAILYAAEVLPTKLRFKILSSGCSQSNHFKLVYNQIEENRTEISIIRLKRDMCRKKYFLKTIELGIEPVLQKQSMQLSLVNRFKFFKYGS